MQYIVSEEDVKGAKWPHDLFLINLIFNHILMFAAFLSASSLWQWVIVVPTASLLILSYSIWRAKRSHKVDSWYVKCHWHICQKRSMMFIGMILLMLVAMGTVILVSGGDPKPQHIALAGAAVLPTMVMVLVLVVMETEALDHARKGRVPDGVVKQFPDGQYEPVPVPVAPGTN